MKNSAEEISILTSEYAAIDITNLDRVIIDGDGNYTSQTNSMN